MDVTARTYYKEQEYNGGICRGKTFVSARFIVAAAMLVSSVCIALAQGKDSTVTSAQAHARIDFKVNLTEFDGTYHNNDSGLEKILTKIDSLVLAPRKSVERIIVVGTASPEGPYHNNVRLATERAKAFISILKSRYTFPDSIYTVTTIPEDWDGMRQMLMEDSSIPYAGVVLRFLDETEMLSPDTREQRLKHLDGGRPYHSIRDNVLPYLRRASVLVDYDTRLMKYRQQIDAYMPEIPVLNTVIDFPDIKPLYITVPGTAPRKRFFALKTNLLGDFALCANLGFEVELWPHWSLDVPVWYSPYDITDRWRLRLLAVQPEVRWWPKDAGSGHYFGAHTTVAGFNISTGGDYRYQDPNHAAFGVGIGYGYSFHLDKAHRWGLEAQIGAGYISYRWIKYHNTGRNGAEVSRSGGTYWGVTRAGVTLSYKFYADRKGRRWMRW